MTNNVVLRRALTSVGLVAGAALAVAGCSSSSNGNPVSGFTSGAAGVASSASSAVSSALPSDTAGSSSSSSAPVASSSSASSSSVASSGGGSKAAACSALTDLVTLSGKIATTVQKSGGAAAHFGELKSLYGQMDTLSKKIALAAPSAIKSDATKFSSSIGTLDAAVQKASSSAEIQTKAASDPKLKAATTGLSSSITNLVTWKTKNC